MAPGSGAVPAQVVFAIALSQSGSCFKRSGALDLRTASLPCRALSESSARLHTR